MAEAIVRPHKIVLKKHGPRHFLEFAADLANIFPGHLVEVQANGAIRKHALAGKGNSRMIAYEDVHQGKTINDAFPITDMVPVFAYLPGDELLVRVAATTPAILINADLASDGAGGVKTGNGTTDVVLFKAMEAVDNSAGATDVFLIVRAI